MRLFIFLAVIAALIVFVVGCGSTDEESSDGSISVQTGAPMTIIVNHYYEKTSSTLTPGNVLLVVNIDFNNFSDFNIKIGDISDQDPSGTHYIYLEVQDKNGNEYVQDVANEVKPSIPALVPADEMVRGYLTYEVPADWKTLTLKGLYSVKDRFDWREAFRKDLVRKKLSPEPTSLFPEEQEKGLTWSSPYGVVGVEGFEPTTPCLYE